MRTVGAVFADFVEAPTGGPSQLLTELAGQTILQRTLRRLARVENLDARCLVVRERDHDVAQQAVADADLSETIEVFPSDTGIRTRRTLLQTARKWSLESWRGNLLGATWFDEYVEPREAAVVLKYYSADAVLCVDGHQPVLDPQIAASMIRHLRDNEHLAQHCFTQAPPGVAGVILCEAALKNLIELNIPYGLLLAYRPELAQLDPITFPACHHVPTEVAHVAARLTGDTRRSREQLDAALRELGDQADAGEILQWLSQPGRGRAGDLPVEVELELSTDDPLPDTRLRPRGSRVPQRRLTDLDAVARLAAQLACYDDRLVVVGGHGDPLLHPRFAEVCRLLRAGGVYGLAVVTPLVELSDHAFDALFANAVDIVEVQIDAHSAATYEHVHGRDAITQALSNIERIEIRRREQGIPQPIVLCSFTRHSATIEETEPFFDCWIERLGSALIRGYNEYCGVLPSDELLETVPGIREPCRRLATRLMLLADGSVPQCGQDLASEARLGDWASEPITDIWCGAGLRELRAAHQTLRLDHLPLCGRCKEWFRV
jgi:spiro-SPASM protein